MSAWMQQQQARGGRAAAATTTEAPELVMHQRISMYKEPPPGEVCIEEFERYAIDRLRVLKGIEEARNKGFKGEQLQALVVQLADKHLKGATPEDSRWKDGVSHFVLRLAYCRTEDLRRWFLQQESDLFRHRFRNEVPSSQVDFMRRHALAYEAVAGEEYNMLKPQLVKVQEAVGNFGFANEIKAPSSRDAFFKVPFEQVPDLVATRRVLLREGWAYVSRHEVASLVVGHFRAGLSRALALTSRRWAAQIADEESERLTPIVLSLSERYLGPDYGEEHSGPQDVVMAAQLPNLARQSFPLCMQHMYQRLHQDSHLKHYGRLQLGLFLKGIGLPLEEAMKFWRAEFGPKCAGEAFDKKYGYGVRYNYAKEGKRTDYTPYSCLKIITTPVPKGEAFGCPYKTHSPSELADALRAMRLPPNAVQEAAQKARNGHFQLACTAAWEGAHKCMCDTGINHPNQYYDESRKVLVAADQELKAKQQAADPVTPGSTVTTGAPPAGKTPPSVQQPPGSGA